MTFEPVSPSPNNRTPLASIVAQDNNQNSDAIANLNEYAAGVLQVNEAPLPLGRHLPSDFEDGDDSTDAFHAAVAALPATGGQIDIGDRRVQLTNPSIDKRVTIVGRGRAESNAETAPTELILAGSGTGLDLVTESISVRNLTLRGAVGNTLDIGLHMRRGRQVVEDVTVFDMAGVGIRLGSDVGAEGVNLSVLSNVAVRGSGGHGVVIDDESPIDANGLLIDGLNVYGNTGDGLRVARCEISNFHGVVAENNGGGGIHLLTGCSNNAFWNPHSETSTPEFLCDAGTSNNLIIGAMNYEVTDNGTNLVLRAAGGIGQRMIQSRSLQLGTTRSGSRATDQVAHVAGQNSASVVLDQLGATADNRLWALTVASQILRGEIFSDDGATVTEWLRVTRTGAGTPNVRVGPGTGSGSVTMLGNLGFFGHEPAARAGAIADVPTAGSATAADNAAAINAILNRLRRHGYIPT